MKERIDFQKWLIHSLTALGFFMVGAHFMLMYFEHQLRALDVLTRVLPCILICLWVFIKGKHVPQLVLVIIALLLNALGDLFLKLPGELFFIFGLFTHLIGHILYIISFTLTNRKLKILRAILPAIYLGFMLFLLLPQIQGFMRIAVLLYACVIVSMLWRAAASIGQKGEIQSAEIFRLAGAFLFVVSDTLLAIKVFIQPIDGIGFPLMATYWAGLWFIAFATIILSYLKMNAR